MTAVEPPWRGWREAMTTALYGPTGFFTTGAGPDRHFRTSAHASPVFAGAVLGLLAHVDAALEHPATLDVVDVGAGRGELLTAVLTAADPALRRRLRPQAVELAGRPVDLPAAITWRDDLPARLCGLLIATEWLDNVPVDVAEVDGAGIARRVRVDPATGAQVLGEPVVGPDADWLARWWPLAGRPPGTRAELGQPRDAAWAAAVAAVDRGCALAVDYGHLRGARPAGGTLTGYRSGRQVAALPDGSCDLTAHVAVDAAAAAVGTPYTLVSQRDALRSLGVHGARPPLGLARTDPVGYLRALAGASAAAELTDPVGLGGHWWLLHPVGIQPPGLRCSDDHRDGPPA